MKPFWGLHNFSTGWFNHQPVALLESVERWVISSLLTLGGGISEEMWYPTTWFGSCQDLLGDTWLMTMVRSVERPLRESGCGTPSNWLCMAAYFRGVWSDHDLTIQWGPIRTKYYRFSFKSGKNSPVSFKSRKIQHLSTVHPHPKWDDRLEWGLLPSRRRWELMVGTRCPRLMGR